MFYITAESSIVSDALPSYLAGTELLSDSKKSQPEFKINGFPEITYRVLNSDDWLQNSNIISFAMSFKIHWHQPQK